MNELNEIIEYNKNLMQVAYQDLQNELQVITDCSENNQNLTELYKSKKEAMEVVWNKFKATIDCINDNAIDNVQEAQNEDADQQVANLIANL